MAITINIDGGQSRLKHDDALCALAASEFDSTTFDNVIFEPVNSLIILKPYRFDKEWFENASGNYARLPLSSFGISSGVWQQQLIPAVSAGEWIGLAATFSGFGTNLNAAGGQLVSSTTYDKNRGFTISYYNYGGSENISKTPLLNVGWGLGIGTSSSYFEIFGDGKINFYKDGLLRQEGSITGTAENNTVRQNKKQQGKTTYSFCDFTAIPYNHNQILCWSLNGGSFVVDLDEIDPDENNPTITPSSKFFINVPANRATKFQFAPIVFHTTGSCKSLKSNFADVPFTTQAAYADTVLKYNGGVGIQSVILSQKTYSGSTFTPNDVDSEIIVKADLSTTNSGYSPTFYGSVVGYQREMDYTNGDYQEDIQSITQSLVLNVPDDNVGATAELTIIDANEEFVTLPNNLAQGLFKPIKIQDGANIIFDGVIVNIDNNLKGNYRELKISAQDKFFFLENYMFSDRFPLAGMQFYDAINFMVSKVIEDGYKVIYDPAIQLSIISDQTMDNWGDLISPGDTPVAKINNIVDSYQPNSIFGFKGQTFFCKPRDQFGITTSITLFPNVGLAITSGFTFQDVYYNLDTKIIPAEANSIRVTGQNPKTKELFQVVKNDLASQDVTTIPSSRPNNWYGFVKKYGISDPAYTNIGIASYACEIMYDRLTKPRVLHEFNSKVLLNASNEYLWKGDKFYMAGIGCSENGIGGTTKVVQIQAIQLNVIRDDYIRATYTVEEI